MDKLTREDITVLLDALEAWTTKDAHKLIMADILTGLIARQNPSHDEQIVAAFERDKADFEEKAQVRRERSIILQAKLLLLRDAIEVEEVTG